MSESSWLPPTYDLSTKPELGHTFAIDDEGVNENFARNARWYVYLASEKCINLQGSQDSRRFHVYGSLRKQNTWIIFHFVRLTSLLLSPKNNTDSDQVQLRQVSPLSFCLNPSSSLTILAHQHDQTSSFNNQHLFSISPGFRLPHPMTPRRFAF